MPRPRNSPSPSPAAAGVPIALAIGYIRVSTDEQSNGAHAQEDALRAWCAKHGHRLAAVHRDIGVSGAADLDDRPGLLSAIDDLKLHGASVLLIAKRDRLARDVAAAALIQRLVERAHATVRSADGMADVAGPEGELLRGLLDLFAQHERALIRSRTRLALAAKKARQERTGGVGWGFRLAADGVHVEPEPAEVRVIQAASRLNAKGLSLRQIAAQLNQRGFRSRKGGMLWPQSVRALLRAG